MAVISSVLLSGPSIQASGRYRGQAEVVLDDRTSRPAIDVVDEAAWDTTTSPAGLVAIGDRVQEQAEQQDATNGIEDEPVEAQGQATKAQRAAAYFLTAWQAELPQEAYRIWDRFNDYRVAEGLSWAQVKTAFVNQGLVTEEQFDDAKAAWDYLSTKVPEMTAYQPVLDNWRAR